jgi:hypothetical protein
MIAIFECDIVQVRGGALICRERWRQQPSRRSARAARAARIAALVPSSRRSELDFRPGRLNILVTNLTDPDLNFIARQNERILTDIASLRDDMAVLTAMVMRLDGSHTALLQETRATHAQIARMNDRIRKLEAEGIST